MSIIGFVDGSAHIQSDYVQKSHSLVMVHFMKRLPIEVLVEIHLGPSSCGRATPLNSCGHVAHSVVPQASHFRHNRGRFLGIFYRGIF